MSVGWNSSNIFGPGGPWALLLSTRESKPYPLRTIAVDLLRDYSKTSLIAYRRETDFICNSEVMQ